MLHFFFLLSSVFMCRLAIDVITFEGRCSGMGPDKKKKNAKISEASRINCEPSLGSAYISFSLAFCFVLHATADVSRALISFFVKGLDT